MQIKILRILKDELEIAIEKEKDAIKEFELQIGNDKTSSKLIVKLSTKVSKASGYTNGIITAINLIK
jgi:hypothetical protein